MPTAESVRERPAIFSGEMVRSVIEGRKTRMSIPVPFERIDPYPNSPVLVMTLRNGKQGWLNVQPEHPHHVNKLCPLGQVHDHLWVRETFCLEEEVLEAGNPPPFKDGRPIKYIRDLADQWVQPHYKATDPVPELCYDDRPSDEPTVKWKPSILMPRWASRLLLEITEISVQRVQEISNEEAIKEGVRKFEDLPSIHPYGQDPRWSMGTPSSTDQCLGSPRFAFANGWNALYEKKGFGWESNPWVWAISFKRVDVPRAE